MFKDKTWGYLLGIVILFAILITLTGSVIFPVIFGTKTIDVGNTFNTAPSYSLDRTKDYLAVLKTNLGNITIDLYEQSTPNNVNNFVHLAQVNYYEGTKFHRLIPGFLVQGGDRNTLDEDNSNDGKGNPGYVIKDEINWNSLSLSQDKQTELKELGYSSTAGVISKPLTTLSLVMANGGPDTNGSQFFIVIAAQDDSRLADLNGRFTVIGGVIDGLDTLNEVANTPVDNVNLKSPRPTQDIILQKVDIFTK